MRSFFLFYLLSHLLRSPWLALGIVIVVVYLAEARYSGRYFNPTSFYGKRHTMRELERTLAVNEHDVAARNDLGRLLVEQGRFDDARGQLGIAIKRMGDSAETNYFYGIALLRTGDVERGVPHIERALQINPRFLYGEPQLALARHHLEVGDIAHAARLAAESVGINTSCVESWVLLGRARDRGGDRDGAREAWRSALEAYDGLPRYLRPGARRWRSDARRALKAARA